MIGAVNQHAGDTGRSHLANRYFLRALHRGWLLDETEAARRASNLEGAPGRPKLPGGRQTKWLASCFSWFLAPRMHDNACALPAASAGVRFVGIDQMIKARVLTGVHPEIGSRYWRPGRPPRSGPPFIRATSAAVCWSQPEKKRQWALTIMSSPNGAAPAE
jgi:hypothetical protein